MLVCCMLLPDERPHVMHAMHAEQCPSTFLELCVAPCSTLASEVTTVGRRQQGAPHLLPVIGVVEEVVDCAGIHHKHHCARAVAKQAEILAAKHLEVASARRVPGIVPVPILCLCLPADCIFFLEAPVDVGPVQGQTQVRVWVLRRLPVDPERPT